jgi:alpha-amylase/alpha-mannosidase (GH57 family)
LPQQERYVCIHGHFYQPPRENPWLEAIELQDSAYPYHDWNARVSAECYATNATSRILNDEGKIVQIVNNYARMSFNFGPTLLAWMEGMVPEVYSAVIDGDRLSRENFSGHGSALAQAYNHMILPLASRRDKYTQIHWGIRDFQRRFGRDPEGMWLPETAVDLESLDIMAELGIRFTILAPRQAGRIRPKGKQEWQDASGAAIDPSRPYLLPLPSGRDIVVFFYDGPISRAVAFEDLLNSGEVFAQRLLTGFSKERSWAQLIHIATDGESYGHHHRHGDMALAYAVHYLESSGLAKLTNYGEYLANHPPAWEVEIFENSSWSCVHGVERWRADCGCNSGGHPPGWNQAWRAPLRAALDWLRDTVAPAFEVRAGQYLKDPWAARDDYIRVILDRSPGNVERFFARHALRPLDSEARITVLKLMELQRHAMLMYTSCGWFFDDLSGIETVQVIQYAGRVVQLANELFEKALEPRFLERIEQARSNLPEYGDGRRIYENIVHPAMLDLERVCAHYAMSSLFEEYAEATSVYCYTVEKEDARSFETGRAKLVVGRAKLASDITGESGRFGYAVLHLGDHNLNCGVRASRGEDDYQAMLEELADTFVVVDFAETIRVTDKQFGEPIHSLRTLFRDEQRRILHLIMEPALADAEMLYRQVYENHAPLMRFMKDLNIPAPKAVYAAAELVINAALRKAFEEEDVSPEQIGNYLEEARLQGITLDADTLEFALRQRLESITYRWSKEPMDTEALQRLQAAMAEVRLLPFRVNLRQVQNLYYEVLQGLYPEMQKRAAQDDRQAAHWIEVFRDVAEELRVQVD